MAGRQTKMRMKRILFPGSITEKVGYKRLFRWSILGSACARRSFSA